MQPINNMPVFAIQSEYVFAYRGHWELQFGRERGVYSGELCGFPYMQLLLKHPNQKIHVKQMGREILGDQVPVHLKRCENAQTFSSESLYVKNDNLIDCEAVKSYQSRLDYLANERRKAIKNNDSIRLHEIDSEFHEIATAIELAKGYRGKIKLLDCSDTTLRNRIARNINTALGIMEDQMPKFVAHLRITIQYGTSMKYSPDCKIKWVFY